MSQYIRYLLVFFFWLIGASSMASSDFLVGLVSGGLAAISVTYSEFQKKENKKAYWIIMVVGFILTLALLYYRGITEYG